MLADDADVLQAVREVRKKNDRDRDGAPEVAPREGSAGDGKDQAIEDIPLVHTRGEREKGKRRDRAGLEQRPRAPVLQVPPNDQRERCQNQRDAPSVLWQKEHVPIVRDPERAAKCPEIKRINAIVWVEVRAERIEVGEPAKRRDCVAGMKRLRDQEREENCRADPNSRRGDARAPAPGIDKGEGNQQRQQRGGLRLDEQGIRKGDPAANDPAR